MARRVLCVALATLLLACLASAAHSNTFFVLGDWGSASIPAFAPTQKSVAVSMGKVAAKLKPNFIVSTGDNFYDAGVESTKDPLWKDAWKSMYDADALQVPWYAALGNHDWMGLVDAQLQFNDKNWKMPANYFSVKDDKLNLTLVVIDTTPLLHLYRTVPESLQMLQQLKVAPPTKEQYDWLEATLKQAAAQTRWTVVVGHHQIYSAHGNGSYETGWEELQKGVQPLFAKYGVHMYLCGHVHNLQHIEAYGVHYFVSGAGSRLQMATRSENTGEATSHFWAEKPGFLALAVDINNITATFYGSNEDVLYTTVVNHNETITEHDDRILGLPPTTLYPIAFVGTFVVIGVSVLAFVLIKRRCAARPTQISLPLEDPTEDTDTLV